MSVRVHIDRLVLDGFDLNGASGSRVGAAVQNELTRLLVERGVSETLRAGGAMPSVPAGKFSPARGATPAQLGRQIAQSVHGGIGGGAAKGK
jgi:hypothetical protein